jgi:hypothetical protein
MKQKKLPCNKITGFYLLRYAYAMHTLHRSGILQEAYRSVGDNCNLTEWEQLHYKMNGGRNHWHNRVQGAKAQFVKLELIENGDPGIFRITQKGIEEYERRKSMKNNQQ